MTGTGYTGWGYRHWVGLYSAVLYLRRVTRCAVRYCIPTWRYCNVPSMSIATQQAQVIQMPRTPGKTEQRVALLLQYLEDNAATTFAYPELTQATGMPYDALLYVLHALVAVGMVDKHEVADGPGRPRVTFQWAQAPRASGARRATAR